jgi:Rha family phage regulatory protein
MSASTPATAPVLTLVNGVPTTTSLDVAAFFGKRHDDVLKAIRKTAAQAPESCARNFADTSIDVPQPNGGTRKTPAIRLSKTGFTLLAMGFTGAKAMAFKLAYIDAFDRMERELTARALLTPSATAAELSSARNRRAHDLAVAYEATLRAAIRRDEPPTLDAIMAWQPADAAPTPGPSLTREQWLLLVNQAQKAQRLADAALTNVAQALWYAKHVTQIINAAAQFDPERDAICRRIAHEDSRAAA